MFDPSAPHIIILLVVVLLLFGSTRLPGAAEALGKSLRIFKHEAKKLGDEDKKAEAQVTEVTTAAQPVLPTPVAATTTQDSTKQQLEDLQRQVQDLRAQRDKQI